MLFGDGVPVFAHRSEHITMSAKPRLQGPSAASGQLESDKSEQAQSLVEELKQFYAKYQP